MLGERGWRLLTVRERDERPSGRNCSRLLTTNVHSSASLARTLDLGQFFQRLDLQAGKQKITQL